MKKYILIVFIATLLTANIGSAVTIIDFENAKSSYADVRKEIDWATVVSSHWEKIIYRDYKTFNYL